jgi:DNA repair exonuclease SbcCD ATPase subunit
MYTEKTTETAGGVASEPRQRLDALQRRDREIVAEIEALQPRLSRLFEIASAEVPAQAELSALDAEHRAAVDAWVADGGVGEIPAPPHGGAVATLRRKIETARAAIESAQRAKQQLEAQRQALLEERGRISGAMDIESAIVLAESLQAQIDALLAEEAALAARRAGLTEAARRLGDIARVTRDEVTARNLYAWQHKLLTRIQPTDWDAMRVKTLAAARAAEALQFRGAVDAFMKALAGDCQAKLQLNGANHDDAR